MELYQLQKSYWDDKVFLKSASLVHLSIVIIFHSNIAYAKHV